MTCTLFSVGDSDLAPASELSLPAYDDLTSSSAPVVAPHTAELGAAWAALHDALGRHAPPHPLAFLGGGGVPFAALDDGARSSGRYHPPDELAAVAAALDALDDATVVANMARFEVSEPGLDELLALLARIRRFAAETIATGHGMIVHKLA